jgi:hypothetical protein
VSQWDAIRTLARSRRASLGDDDIAPAKVLIDCAAAATGVGYALLPANHALLYGAQGVYDPEYRMLWVDASLPAAM